MQLELAEKLAELINDFTGSFDSAEVRRSYSGRGMYGRGTAAIVTEVNLGQILSMVIEAADMFVDAGGDSIFENVDDFSIDNMGKSDYVIY
jgi:hypothetical protein